MLRPLIATLLGVLTATVAQAACDGRDLFAKLEQDRPAVAARLLEEARAVPFGEGRYWRIEKDGVAPSHVFGTYHVAQATQTVPEAVWSALSDARIAIFEVALDEQIEMQRRMQSEPALSLSTDAVPFSERFDGHDLALLRMAFGARGVPAVAAERLKPWVQFSLLAFPPCQIEIARSGPEMLDMSLARRARAAGVPQIGLEDPLEAVSLIDRMNPDLRDRLMLATVRLADVEEDAFATAMALYRAGRIAMVMSFNEWLVRQEAPEIAIVEANNELYRELLDGRNAKWMPRLLEEADQGGAFIAVGALHLIGEKGLIAGFERAGYTVERLDTPAE